MDVTTVVLPEAVEVDALDESVGKLLSGLDSLAVRVEHFVGDDLAFDDAVFMARAGVAFDSAPRDADPALVARLLVFANELEEDRDRIKEHAARLREALLRCYREFVLERPRSEAPSG